MSQPACRAAIMSNNLPDVDTEAILMTRLDRDGLQRDWTGQSITYHIIGAIMHRH